MTQFQGMILILMIWFLVLGNTGFFDDLGGRHEYEDIIIICDLDDGVGMLLYNGHDAAMFPEDFERVCVQDGEKKSE